MVGTADTDTVAFSSAYTRQSGQPLGNRIACGGTSKNPGPIGVCPRRGPGGVIADSRSSTPLEAGRFKPFPRDIDRD